MNLVVIFKILYYLLFLLWPLLAYGIFRLYKKFSWSWLFIVCLSTLVIWSGFFEPRLLTVNNWKMDLSHEEKLSEPLKVIFISDLHFSLVNRPHFMRRVAKRINELQPDVVLLGGDYVYYENKARLDSDFDFLNDISAVKLAVLGNHDRGLPGDDLSPDLSKILIDHGVIIIERDGYYFEKEGHEIFFWGIGDLWTSPVFYESIKGVSDADIVVAVSHNPDIAYFLPRRPDLLISGHTHGGQVRIPWLYELMIPSNYGFNRGIYIVNNFKVLVSSGLGTIGLPFRFLDIPVIEALEIY